MADLTIDLMVSMDFAGASPMAATMSCTAATRACLCSSVSPLPHPSGSSNARGHLSTAAVASECGASRDDVSTVVASAAAGALCATFWGRSGDLTSSTGPAAAVAGNRARLARGSDGGNSCAAAGSDGMGDSFVPPDSDSPVEEEVASCLGGDSGGGGGGGGGGWGGREESGSLEEVASRLAGDDDDGGGGGGGSSLGADDGWERSKHDATPLAPQGGAGMSGGSAGGAASSGFSTFFTMMYVCRVSFTEMPASFSSLTSRSASSKSFLFLAKTRSSKRRSMIC